MPGFAEGCEFVVSLAFRKGFDLFGAKTRALFLLASYLGGLGRRSRRGMGSFRVSAITEPSDTGAAQLINAPTFNDITSFQQYIFDLLEVLAPNEFAIDGCFIRRSTYQNPGYPIIRNIGFGQHPQTPHSIHAATHTVMGTQDGDTYGKAMGYVKGKRLASPMYTSLVKIADHLYPIATELASTNELDEPIVQIRKAYRQQLHIQ
jgi:CRISPR-associated protein Cmr1